MRKSKDWGWLRYGLLPLLLTFCLSPALARSYGLFIAGVEVTDENRDKLDKIGGVNVATGGELKYNPSTKTLSLKDVEMTVKGKTGIYNETLAGLKIAVAGNNKITVNDEHGLSLKADTSLEGAGSLTVKATNFAVWTNARLTLADLTIDTQGKFGFVGDKQSSSKYNGDLIIKNALVKAQGSTGAICYFNTFTLNESLLIEPGEGGWDKNEHVVLEDMEEDWKARNVKIVPFYGLYIAGQPVTSENVNNLGSFPGVTIGANGLFTYNRNTKTLTMKNVTITGPDRRALIDNRLNPNFTIEVLGDNKITNKEYGCLEFHTSSTIKGSGKLTIMAEGASYEPIQFFHGTTLSIADVTLDLSGAWGICGQHLMGVLNIQNATITTNCSHAALGNFYFFYLKQCFISEPEVSYWDKFHHVLKKDGENVKRLKISPFILNLDQTTLANVPATGGKPSVKVTANKPWKLSIPSEATWVTPSETSGTGDKQITFTVSKNESFSPRSATVTFTQAESNKTVQLEITQAAATPILTLDPTTVAEIPAAGGAPAVKLTSNRSWTLSIPSEATWVTPSETSGTGDKQITFTVSKNDSFTPRSATVTFTQAESNKTLQLEIKQAAATPIFTLDPTTMAEIPAAGGEPAVKLTSNKPWTLTILSEAPWVTSSVKEGVAGTELPVTFTVLKNESFTPRSATVTFTQAESNKTVQLEITQVAATPIFTLDPTTVAEIPAAGGESVVKLTSNKPWTLSIRSEATWVTSSVKEGVAGTELPVTFTVSTNDNFSPRSATVTFTQAESNKTVQLEIKQAAATPIFTLDPTTMAEIPAAGGEPAVKLTSNKPWTLTILSEAPWVTSSVKEGVAGTELPVTFTVLKNESFTPRSATVTFTQAESNKTVQLEITQVAATPIFTLDPTTVAEIPAAGGESVVKLTSNKPWTLSIRSEATWVTSSVKEGVAGTELPVTFTVSTNDNFSPRSATVTFTQAESNKTVQLEIKQAAATPIFTLDPTTVAEIPAAGGESVVKLTSNKPWTLSIRSEATWVTSSVKEGAAGAELPVTFTVSKNESFTPRSATVTFTQAESNKTLTLEIRQAAAMETTVPLTDIKLRDTQLPLKVGESAKLNVTFVPENATNKAVTWAVTEGAASLTVDQEGNITATQVAGTAKVTVTSKENPTISATCTVTVTATPVPSPTPNPKPNPTPTPNPKPTPKPEAVEEALLANVTVAPNPFTTQLRLVNPAGIAAAYELVNVSGVVLRSGEVSTSETIIDTTDLPAGLYFLRIGGQNDAKRTVRVVRY